MRWNFKTPDKLALIELRMRFLAVRAVTFILYYTSSLTDDIPDTVDEIYDFFGIIILCCIVVSVYHEAQVVRVHCYSDMLVQMIVSFLWSQIFKYICVSIIYSFYLVCYIISEKIKFFFRYCRYLFIVWKPFFKKFGYLLNFFKKKK